MALSIALILAGVAIGLLVIYATDVAVAMSSGSDYGFLPLDHMQRGMGLGGPALILPIIAFFISRREPSRGLGAMIVISGILIAVGGLVILAMPASIEASARDPVASTAMMFVPATIQLVLGSIKIARSST